MTTLQTLSTPQLDTEDVMELSTEADPLIGQANDVDIDIDITENQLNDEVDEDMSEDFDDRIDQYSSHGLDDLQEASTDAPMEDNEIQVSQEYATRVQDEFVLNAAATEADVDEDLIVDDLLDDVGETLKEKDHSSDTVVEGNGKVLDQFQETVAEDQNLATEPDASHQANTLEDNYTDVPTARSSDRSSQDDNGTLSEQQLEIESEKRIAIPSNSHESIPETQIENVKPSQKELNEPSPTYAAAHTEDINASLDKMPAEPMNKLHPVFVTYQDTTMSLFPPVHHDSADTQIFLLQDERIATENIRSLLDACRVVLEDSISEDDELEIAIGELGLQIIEVRSLEKKFLNHVSNCLQSASINTEITLLQLVDLYTRLYSNDGEDNAPPLHVHLLTKTSLSHRWRYLINLVNEGKGLSHARPIHEYVQEDTNDGLNQEVESGHEDTDAFQNENNNSDKAGELSQELPIVGDLSAVEPKLSKIRNEIEPAAHINSPGKRTDPGYRSILRHDIQSGSHGNPDMSKQGTYASRVTSGQEIAATEDGTVQERLHLVTEREDFTDDEAVQNREQDSPTNSSALRSRKLPSSEHVTLKGTNPAQFTKITVGATDHTYYEKEGSVLPATARLDNGDMLRDLSYHEPALDVVNFHDDSGERNHDKKAATNQQEHTDQSKYLRFDVNDEVQQEIATPERGVDLSPNQEVASEEDDLDHIDETIGQDETGLDYSPDGAYQADNSEIDPQNYDETDDPQENPNTDETSKAEDQVKSKSMIQDNDDDIFGVGEEESIHAEQHDSNELEEGQHHNLRLGDPKSTSNSVQQDDTESGFGEDELYSEPFTQAVIEPPNASTPQSFKRLRSDGDLREEETSVQSKARYL